MTLRYFCDSGWLVILIMCVALAFGIVLGANVADDSKVKDCTNLGAFRIDDVVYVCEKKK